MTSLPVCSERFIPGIGYSPLSSADASGRESTTSGHYRPWPTALESPLAAASCPQRVYCGQALCHRRRSLSPGAPSAKLISARQHWGPRRPPAHGRHNPFGVHSDPGSAVSGRGRLLDRRRCNPISLRISELSCGWIGSQRYVVRRFRPLSAVILAPGWISAVTRAGSWLRNGLKMIAIRLGAAAIGFAIGRLLNAMGA